MRLLNLLIEKRVMFMSLLLLLMSMTLVSGDIKFTYDDVSPWISGGPDNLVRKQEIITGEVVWPNGREIWVSVYGFATGLGIGEGTLEPVTILGYTYKKHQDGSEDVGEETSSGKWKYGDETVRTRIARLIPKMSEETSYPWSAKGTVTLIPYVWQETVTEGGAIRFPLSIQGSYSKSGTWKLESARSTTQAAADNSGTHGISHKIYCSVCDAEGETAEAIGGADAHKETECKREGCGVKFRICDTAAAALHSICEGCSTYKCDKSTGKYHAKVTCSESTGCGKEYWACGPDASPHTTTVNGGCGHSYLTCVSDDHAYRQNCTNTDANGISCNVGGYYECVSHTCTFNNSNPPNITYNDTTFEVYETLEVTVTKKDLYMINLYIDGEYVTYAYPGSHGPAVVSYTFDSGDAGQNFSVSIHVYSGDQNAPDYSTHGSAVSVE